MLINEIRYGQTIFKLDQVYFKILLKDKFSLRNIHFHINNIRVTPVSEFFQYQN